MTETPDAHMVETLRLRTEALRRVIASNGKLRCTLARVEALANQWQADHDSGGNGRHGYHATEYGDCYAADLRAALDGTP